MAVQKHQIRFGINVLHIVACLDSLILSTHLHKHFKQVETTSFGIH